MAQLVEHMLGKHEVPGPNPGSSSKHPRGFSSGLWFFMGIIDFAVALPRAMGCFGVLPSRTGDRHGAGVPAQLYSPCGEFYCYAVLFGYRRVVFAPRVLRGEYNITVSVANNITLPHGNYLPRGIFCIIRQYTTPSNARHITMPQSGTVGRVACAHRTSKPTRVLKLIEKAQRKSRLPREGAGAAGD